MEVLGGGAHHAGTADVDIGASRLGAGTGLGCHAPERVQVHDNKVNRDCLRPRKVGAMRLVVRLGEKPQVDPEVECLHEAALHLGLPGVVGNLPQPAARGCAQDLLHGGMRSARGEELDLWNCGNESRDKKVEPRFVPDAHEGGFHPHPVVDRLDSVEGHQTSEAMLLIFIRSCKTSPGLR